jgi:uncharacterized protein (TIGR03118 family)
MPKQLRGISLVVLAAIAACAALAGPYTQVNLVSNIPGNAPNTDSNLQNAWGISFSPAGSPFWVSDNHAGVSTLYNSTGVPFPQPTPLVVTIPGVGTNPGAPTGQIFNLSGAVFGAATGSDAFIFAGEDGIISGWRKPLGTIAERLVDNSAAGSVYKGLAFSTDGTNSYLYAADFHNNKIDVIPSAGAPALTGNFTDPNVPSGYAPFNIQNIDNKGLLYVTYAKQDSAGMDDESCGGCGYVSVFDTNGVLQKSLVSQGSLNAPWGLALAPAGWGTFGGDLLVGNFGDGLINVFDPATGNMIGTLSDSLGKPLFNDGLWGLTFGNGGLGGSTNTLYFSAGPNDENDGLFGSIVPTPEPGTLVLFSAGAVALLIARRSRS